MGTFLRGGKKRLEVKVFDHDIDPDEKLVPFAKLLPQTGEDSLWFAESMPTTDSMVDRLEGIWPKLDEKWRPQIRVMHDCLVLTTEEA